MKSVVYWTSGDAFGLKKKRQKIVQSRLLFYINWPQLWHSSRNLKSLKGWIIMYLVRKCQENWKCPGITENSLKELALIPNLRIFNVTLKVCLDLVYIFVVVLLRVNILLLSSGWTWTYSVAQISLDFDNPVASASQVIGLKVCATTSGIFRL